MKNLPLLDSCNIDGKAVSTFTAQDKDERGANVVFFHADVNENIEINGIHNIKKLRDWLIQCIQLYEGEITKSRNFVLLKPKEGEFDGRGSQNNL